MLIGRTCTNMVVHYKYKLDYFLIAQALRKQKVWIQIIPLSKTKGM